MAWEDMVRVKKGDLGEEIVDAYFRRAGILPYQPVYSGPHPFDRLIASSDKKSISIVDVKTKPRRKFYPDTGIDRPDYESYLEISKKHHLRVYLFFVDEIEGRIYGNYLDVLMQPTTIVHNGRRMEYPIIESKIVYFPLSLMEEVATLSHEETEKLEKLSDRSYEYQRRNNRAD